MTGSCLNCARHGLRGAAMPLTSINCSKKSQDESGGVMIKLLSGIKKFLLGKNKAPLGFLVIVSCLHINQVIAATIFDVEKILADIPAVLPQGAKVILKDGAQNYPIQVESIKALHEVHKRLGEVAKIQANLAISVNAQPNASAIPLKGKNLIVISTGMLDVLGVDRDMMASLIGHEYAHHLMKHSFERVLNLPNFVYGAVSIGQVVAQRSGDLHSGQSAANTAMGLMFASFTRNQEAEADKVGTELMSDAKYNPEGSIRLINVMIKRFGSQKTSYFDSHPGFQERLSNAEPVVLNQRYDSIAADFLGRKEWRALSDLVNQWLKVSPESARGWYYRGAVLKAYRRRGVLEAFERALNYDSNFIPARLAYCVELYAAGRERDSLVCAEYLPRNQVYDEYVARTFKDVVHVGGFSPRVNVSEQDLRVLGELLGRQK